MSENMDSELKLFLLYKTSIIRSIKNIELRYKL